ncbi:MAG: hypothetical protein AB8G18_07055 [Gammaproteobacteria bacterium]
MKQSHVAHISLLKLSMFVAGLLFSTNPFAATTACENGNPSSQACEGAWHFLWADISGQGADQMIIYTDGLWKIDDEQTDNIVFGDGSYTPIAGDWNGSSSDFVGLHSKLTGDVQLVIPSDEGYDVVQIPCTDPCIPGGIPITGKWSCEGDVAKDQVGIFYAGSGNESDGTLLVWEDSAWREYLVPGAGTKTIPISGQWQGNEQNCDGFGFYSQKTGYWRQFASIRDFSEVHEMKRFYTTNSNNVISTLSSPVTARVIPGSYDEFGLIAHSSVANVPHDFTADCIEMIIIEQPEYWFTPCPRSAPPGEFRRKEPKEHVAKLSDTIIIIRPSF